MPRATEARKTCPPLPFLVVAPAETRCLLLTYADLRDSAQAPLRFDGAVVMLRVPATFLGFANFLLIAGIACPSCTSHRKLWTFIEIA